MKTLWTAIILSFVVVCVIEGMLKREEARIMEVQR